MIEIDLRFDRAFGELIDETVTAAGRGPDEGIAECARQVTRDTDLGEVWSDDLAASLGSDFDALEALVGHPEFGRGAIALEDDAAVRLLRGLSALRLKLRENELSGMLDSDLEAGEVDPEDLDYGQRRGFAAYVFFAALQELIVRQLDL